MPEAKTVAAGSWDNNMYVCWIYYRSICKILRL